MACREGEKGKQRWGRAVRDLIGLLSISQPMLRANYRTLRGLLIEFLSLTNTEQSDRVMVNCNTINIFEVTQIRPYDLFEHSSFEASTKTAICRNPGTISQSL